MEPNDNKVWISREEYARLQQLENQAPTIQPYVSPIATEDKAAKLQAFETQQMIVGGFLALVLVLALIVPGLGFLVGPLVIIFATLAILAFDKYRKIQQSKAVTLTKTTKIILIILGCLIVLPALAFGALILFFIFILSVGGGAGS